MGWILVAVCCVAPAEVDPEKGPSITEDFHIRLPETVQEVPEPRTDGQGGFAMRGTKGWLWKPEQYVAEVPVLAKYKMNFLMICYGSMCDIEHYAWGDPQCNRWWEPLPNAKREAYEALFRLCREHDIELCLSMNPNLFASRILEYGNERDLDALWQHYAWMQGLGMKWFSVCLDDIERGIDAAGQARTANAVFRRLRANDPEAHLIFCPTLYWGDGSDEGAKPYLETLARELDKEVYVFWTGDKVVTPTITRRAAEAYKQRVGHRLFLWDNYPVNDAHQTLHLGPVTGRDADLHEVIHGYMSNPLHSQNEINRIPLITCADYAYNPSAYDPARAIGQVIVHCAESEEQRGLLKDLIELYPGMLVFGKGTNWNPVLERFRVIQNTPHAGSVAQGYVSHVEKVTEGMRRAFPARFRAAQDTLQQDAATLRREFNDRYR